MKKALGIGLLATGIVLTILGLNASDSIGSEVSRFFTGAPTDEAIWLLIGGIGAASAGFFLTFASRKSVGS